MASLALILATERNAAKLLDMKPADFRGLVDAGVLPKPAEIGGFERWDVEQLRAIALGDLANGAGVIEW
ncbi:hypothetical protein Q4543_06925 [Salipiger sp. 1_MG-2023]|uniref:hypothetical protein n=1 Tax=Salipiger sp. 1_MG-2023 TaxID=3062665 RepID=UPI0026E28B81|nr:hypothetical protein [Salipiger sp. 1_MG-2023]MDO6585247.1 hypothetical protein [Salipiger sp. 1_MG-2023]